MTRQDELLALVRQRWPEIPEDTPVVYASAEEAILLYQFRLRDGSFGYAGYRAESGLLAIHIGRQHCCTELAWSLGSGGVYPTPAYISPANWARHGHLDWWYPGADGPGYYMLQELLDEEWEPISTPAGVEWSPKIEYRRLNFCPYCGVKLQHVERNSGTKSKSGTERNPKAFCGSKTPIKGGRGFVPTGTKTWSPRWRSINCI